MHLDNIDRKLLGLLSVNSRMHYTALAKKLRLERNVVKYRINRLARNNIIRGFETELDYQKLGYQEYICYFSLFRFDSATKERAIIYLKNHDFINWVAECLGRYQIKTRISAANAKSLRRILTQIKNYFGSNLRDFIVLQITGHLKQKNQTAFSSPELVNSAEIKAVKLDEKNRLILNYLSENSRKTLVDIHKKTGLSIESIRQRIKRLEQTGIIKGYTININQKALGIVVWGDLLIRFKNLETILPKLQEFVMQKRNIGRSFLLAGNWNVEIGFSAEKIDILHELIGEFLTRFSENFADYELIFNCAGHKYPPIAAGVLESKSVHSRNL